MFWARGQRASVVAPGFPMHDPCMTGHSKTERMQLRRELGNRVIQAPVVLPLNRGPAHLWPHACFICRKSWKLAEESTAKCPECGAPLRWMGRAFKVPRKADNEQWQKVQALWSAGFRFFHSPSRKGLAEPFPERLRDVESFARRNPEHPFRVKG